MKPWELFEFQKTVKYNDNVADYNWNVTVNKEEKTIYVFTQCSSSTLDWIVNFLFFFIPQVRQWFVYFAAMGWQSAFNSCKGLIMNDVLEAINHHPDYKIVCAGHSYGGAGSVLVGIEIFFQTGRKTDLITWGAPKPLVFILSKLVSRKFFNVATQYAHKSDIVTYMPPFIGYYNVKVVRLGKFSFKGLFDPWTYHTCYGDEKMYEGKVK